MQRYALSLNNLQRETIMSDENFKKLQEEFGAAMSETLENSKVTELLDKYGLVDKNAISIKLVVDANYVKSNENLTTEPQMQLKSALAASSINEIELMTCCYCPSTGGMCCPCSC